MEFFFNCDWGTSRFRLRLIETETVTILQEHTSDQGVGRLAESSGVSRDVSFRQVLHESIQNFQKEVSFDLSAVPILISGMASSTMGWRDLPYARAPFSLLNDELPYVMIREGGCAPIVLFSGLRCDHDIMRGEEVELIGWSALARDVVNDVDELCVVLPGTHSKHVRVQRGIVTSFQTHLTGELFQLLSQRSSLRHADGEMRFSQSAAEESWKGAFCAGVRQVAEQGVSASLFQVRSRQILSKANAADSAAFLSGLLTGGELLSLFHQPEPRPKIVLLASGELQDLYRLAFEQLGLQNHVSTLPAQETARLTALGQRHLARTIFTESPTAVRV